MAKKVLSIIDMAYRATLEEQDDTGVWFTHILRQSGADITILLTGNAVNYAVRGQQPPGLRFGTATIESPPRLIRICSRRLRLTLSWRCYETMPTSAVW